MKVIIISVCLLLACACTPIDNSLDGKILKDEQGNIYKLEWKSGWGPVWAFKYPVTKIYNGDTITVWLYYGDDKGDGE